MSEHSFPHVCRLALLVAWGTTCGLSAAAHAAPAPHAGVARGAKHAIAGLIDMQDIAWHNLDGGEPTFTLEHVERFPGLFGGIVVNAAWDQIQRTPTGPLEFSTIDAALAQVKRYNAANPAGPLGVKLRVYAGTSAPRWAKRLGKGPIDIVRNPKGCQAPPCALTIGAFWAPELIAAWRAFQAQLAARYDDEPLIRQVAITSCASQTDEPFVPTSDAKSRTNMASAGYSDAAQQACLMGAVRDYAAWKHTLLDYTVNVFSKAGGGLDDAFPVRVMQACRAQLGARCVLENHALSVPLRAADDGIYRALKKLGGPIHFQTESPHAMGCRWTATIAQGVALGAMAIEVWPEAKYQGFDALSLANVRQLAAEFTHPIPVRSLGPPPDSCSGFH